MAGRIFIRIISGSIAGAAAWGYSETGNIFILLTAVWFGTLVFISVAAPSKYLGNSARLHRRTGMLSTIELGLITGGIGIFSLVAYWTIDDHWFFLLHGVWWTLVGVTRFMPSPRRY